MKQSPNYTSKYRRDKDRAAIVKFYLLKGFVPLKSWLIDISEREGLTIGGAFWRVKAGKIAPKEYRVINERVILVKP